MPAETKLSRRSPRHTRHPIVLAARLDCATMGEEVCAWIQLASGESLIEDDVKSFCRGQITHFKIPKYIRFVDEFPMTVTGKIQKFKMSETMAGELAAASK